MMFTQLQSVSEATRPFMRFDLGNVITIIAVVIGYAVTYVKQIATFGIQMRDMQGWRRGHELDAKKRDTMIQNQEVQIALLKQMAESSEYRLRNIEQQHGRRPDHGDND